MVRPHLDRGGWGRPKRLITSEDWAPYGIGEPDADGWFPDYRPVPPELRPPPPTQAAGKQGPKIDGSLSAMIRHWRLVVADMAEVYHIDLYHPDVLAGPWQGIRTMIFALLDRPGTRLRAALTIKE